MAVVIHHHHLRKYCKGGILSLGHLRLRRTPLAQLPSRGGFRVSGLLPGFFSRKPPVLHPALAFSFHIMQRYQTLDRQSWISPPSYGQYESPREKLKPLWHPWALRTYSQRSSCPRLKRPEIFSILHPCHASCQTATTKHETGCRIEVLLPS